MPLPSATYLWKINDKETLTQIRNGNLKQCFMSKYITVDLVVTLDVLILALYLFWFRFNMVVFILAIRYLCQIKYSAELSLHAFVR